MENYQCNGIKCILRGGFIVDHLKNTMGYSMRTAEWRYTEWVGIMFYILFDVLVGFWLHRMGKYCSHFGFSTPDIVSIVGIAIPFDFWTPGH